MEQRKNKQKKPLGSGIWALIFIAVLSAVRGMDDPSAMGAVMAGIVGIVVIAVVVSAVRKAAKARGGDSTPFRSAASRTAAEAVTSRPAAAPAYTYDGDGDTDRPEDVAYENSLFFNASSNKDHRPKVLDRARTEVVDPEEVYSGCWVQAVVNFYPYNKVSRGIGASLLAIRKIKDGEPLTGSVVTDADFNDDLLGDIADDDLL